MRWLYVITSILILASSGVILGRLTGGPEGDPATKTAVPERPLIVAHRGASAAAPENTLPAFELAWSLEADAIEGDFHLTKDGEIVCIHDKDTEKVTAKQTRLVVKDSTLAELQALDVGSWFGEKWKGVTAPTLADVLATVPDGKKIYVEIKCGPEVLPRLHEVLDASGLAADQIVLISFNADVIRGYKEKRPKRKAYWLTGVRKSKLGLREPSVGTVLETLRASSANGVGSSASELVDRQFVDAIRRAGFEYHVWTIDDPLIAARFRKLGAGSITTNKPALIRRELFAPKPAKSR